MRDSDRKEIDIDRKVRDRQKRDKHRKIDWQRQKYRETDRQKKYRLTEKRQTEKWLTNWEIERQTEKGKEKQTD